MLQSKQISETIYELRFNIQPLADQIGISKDKLAELMADEFMKLLALV